MVMGLIKLTKHCRDKPNHTRSKEWTASFRVDHCRALDNRAGYHVKEMLSGFTRSVE